MTTSQETSSLSKPVNGAAVPLGTFGYFRARNRSRIYELVLSEFMKSGITQTELAKRMSKGTDQVCRWLGAPGNWTLDTISDLIFAISGGEVLFSMSYPLDQPVRNFRTPSWFTEDTREDAWVEKRQAKMAKDCLPEQTLLATPLGEPRSSSATVRTAKMDAQITASGLSFPEPVGHE